MGSNDSAHRVVIGVDGSPSSQAALRWAVRYANLIGGSVVAIYAWELPGMYGWSAPAVDADLDEEVARDRFGEEIREVLGDTIPVELRQRLVRGNPTAVLLAAAEGGRGTGGGQPGQGRLRQRAARLGEPAVRTACDVSGGHCPPGHGRGTAEPVRRRLSHFSGAR
jgi:nucleotide-binding universal stress UspA family protein